MKIKLIVLIAVTCLFFGTLVTTAAAYPSWFATGNIFQDSEQENEQSAENTAISGTGSFITLAQSNQENSQETEQDAETNTNAPEPDTNTIVQESNQHTAQNADNTAISGPYSFITIATSNQETTQNSSQTASTNTGTADGSNESDLEDARQTNDSETGQETEASTENTFLSSGVFTNSWSPF